MIQVKLLEQYNFHEPIHLMDGKRRLFMPRP
jgi:predicted HTH domain antitoxin